MINLIKLYDINNDNYEDDNYICINNIIISSKYDSGEINEIESIEITCEIDEDGISEYIQEGCVIRCNTSLNKEQLFKIITVENDSEANTKTLLAKQIFYTCKKIIAKDLKNDDVCICATGNVNGEGAIKKLLEGTKFIGHSNITNKYDSVRWQRKSITEALLSEDENSYVNIWGGELVCNKFDIYMNDRCGTDNNVQILYGKNMKYLKQKIDIDSLITRIIPIGYDGLRLTGKTPWIDSKYINNYNGEIYERVIEFPNVKVKESNEDDGFETEEEARKELIRLSKLMFEEEKVDTPSINLKISMVDLSNTEEYKEYFLLDNGEKFIEEIDKGDDVFCNHYKFNVTTKSRVIRVTKNLLTLEIDEAEIGDVNENYFDKQAELSKIISSLLDGDKIKADKISGILNGLETKFKAQYNIAEKQHVRAMLYECLDHSLPQYGALAIGSAGIEIANERNAENTGWKWNTFITGGLVYSDWLIGKLRTVLITNSDDSFQIDLNSTGGAKFYYNGNLAMRMQGSSLDFYNIVQGEQYIGSLSNTCAKNPNGTLDSNKPYVELYNNKKSAVAIGYKDENDDTIYPYLRFDKYGIRDGKHMTPISAHQNIGFFNYKKLHFFGDDTNVPLGLLGLDEANNMYAVSGQNWKFRIGWIKSYNVETGVDYWDYNFEVSPEGVKTWVSLKAYGDKNCIQTIEDDNTGEEFEVKYSSTEDIGAYLVWTCYGCKYETKKSKYSKDKYYSCIVKIPEIVKKTLNTKGNYNVNITVVKSFANARIWTMSEDYFIVKSDEPCKFNFELKGRRKNFETRSLEEEEERYLKFKEEQQEKYNKDLTIKSKIKLRFKRLKLKPNFPLWLKCAKEWEEYGECLEG